MTAALDGGEWSAARPGRILPPGIEPVPVVQEAGWDPGPVWKGRKSRPHRDSIPDRPARSSVAIPTELPGPLGSLLLSAVNSSYIRSYLILAGSHVILDVQTKHKGKVKKSH